LCERVGLAALGDDERYDSVRKRAEHAAEIVPRLQEAFSVRTALEWEAHFGDEVPCAAVRNLEDVFDNPQVLAEELVTTTEHPLVGRYRGLSRSIKFARTPGPAPSAAPVFGQHTDAILADGGFTPEEVVQLRATGAIL
jgi:crotonobetainyl-CoA:carnitine CoA-transferase CaiB-like acyl-CoA transferase